MASDDSPKIIQAIDVLNDLQRRLEFLKHDVDSSWLPEEARRSIGSRVATAVVLLAHAAELLHGQIVDEVKASGIELADITAGILDAARRTQELDAARQKEE